MSQVEQDSLSLPESSQFAMQCVDRNHDIRPAIRDSVGYKVPLSSGGIVMTTDTDDELLMSQHGHCGNKVLEIDTQHDPSLGNPIGGPNIFNLDGWVDSQQCYPMNSADMLGLACCQALFDEVSLTHSSNGVLIPGCDNLGFEGISCQVEDLDLDSCSISSLLSPSRIISSFGADKTTVSEPVEEEQKKEPVKLEVFGSGPSNVMESVSCIDESAVVHTANPDSGSLCHEPPHFPSVEIPFVSCDLLSSGDEAYSPFGIRKLMMSSLNVSNSCSFWDPPSCDDSPVGILKTAAKSFLCTPTILRKRHRDLLTPVKERNSDEKTIGRADLSSMDVGKAALISPSYNPKKKSFASFNQKENMDPASRCRLSNVDDRISCKALECGDLDSRTGTQTECSKSDADGRTDVDITKKRASGILVEQDMNDLLLYSPSHVEHYTKSTTEEDMRILSNLLHDSLEISSNHDGPNARLLDTSAFLSPDVGERKLIQCSGPVPSLNNVTSSQPMQATCDKVWSSMDADIENKNILADTSGIKRSRETPSAWKSPWFMHSFLGRLEAVGCELDFNGCDDTPI
ncbi:Myb-related protein 3R-1 [Acorus calamus]|uniref:Myb-related protein 3R-1 n=1 Tax=Acorus calamus TaxID=4465 RepID=A0AAV9EUA2_ACOCL|nr:Myb-related protein 3R-1 [Acorus calamus]